MKQETKTWLALAEKDIKLVERIFNDPEFVEISAFHLQQAIEKILKAYIKEKIGEPPKIHNVIGLMNVARLSIEQDLRQVLEDLNYVYVESRYTSSIEEFKDFLTVDRLEKLYNETQRLMLWIKNML